MKAFDAKHYLLSAQILWERIEDKSIYPYSLPAISKTESITFHPELTFLVGENGSGKSTMVEALAVAWGFNPEGGTVNHRTETRSSHSDLHKHLRLVRSFSKARTGFFLRAESMFNIATAIDDIGYMEAYGGKSLHEQSHGESFFALLEHRFGGNGLYILDEPEAALSPKRQMSMLTRMRDLIRQKSQFIIATHSPILMAYPGAKIYHVTDRGLVQITYEETEHFQVTRNFLNRHVEMVKQLLGE